jgi:hypothetical protein
MVYPFPDLSLYVHIQLNIPRNITIAFKLRVEICAVSTIAYAVDTTDYISEVFCLNLGDPSVYVHIQLNFLL